MGGSYKTPKTVTPAKAGVRKSWIPAFAGKTLKDFCKRLMGLATERRVLALAIVLVVFGVWMGFSTELIAFYRDDNVVATVPLLIEAARQVKSGSFPWHTYYVGGGGGTPLVSIMQPGVLSPLRLLPAMILGGDPELTINVIVSLHLALFALGGWYLAGGLRAPPWAGLVAAFSLGFSGSYAIGAGNSDQLFLPYTFLPWIAGGIVKLTEVDSGWDRFVAHVVTAWASLSVFFSGTPTAAFYGSVVILCCVGFILLRAPGKWKTLKALVRGLFPHVVLIVAVAGPLLLSARDVYEYHGRATPSILWKELSVPLPAYLGLLLPFTSSEWLHIGAKADFSNVLLFCGFVPAWFIVLGIGLRPDLLKKPEIICLMLGVVLFVPILSPADFGLSDFFSRTPILQTFRWPYRGLPGLELLVVFLFLAVSATVEFPQGRRVGMALVSLSLASAVVMFGYEYKLARPGSGLISWFTTSRYYEDPETWSPRALARLRESGYLMTVCSRRPQSPWFEKPRLCFMGNLGAQFRVPTVHRYLIATSGAYRTLGMHYSGLTDDWPVVKDFIEVSLKTPPIETMAWANGIGPVHIAELAAKTYVGAVVVENALNDPIAYFLASRQWALLESRGSMTVFVRRVPEVNRW